MGAPIDRPFAHRGKLFDVRCLGREQLIDWLHQAGPQSIPRCRVQLIEAEPELRPARGDFGAADESALFSGDESGRGQQFTGPVSTLPSIGAVPSITAVPSTDR